MNPKQVAIGQPLTVSVKVSNTGKRAGDEVVQLYLHDRISSVTRPVMELKDFQRISLAPGESRKVSFTLTAEKLQFYDINMNRVVEAGDFQVMVGTSSADCLTNTFRVIK